MTDNAFGLIYAGESNMQLRDLTTSRSIAAVPFGGRYRCIDFVLSCMVNSGISNIGLITQKNYHSLMDHLGSGKPWDFPPQIGIISPQFTTTPFSIHKSRGDCKGKFCCSHKGFTANFPTFS